MAKKSEHIPMYPIELFQWDEHEHVIGTAEMSDLREGFGVVAADNHGFIVKGKTRNITFELTATADDGEGGIASWTFESIGNRAFKIIVFND